MEVKVMILIIVHQVRRELAWLLFLYQLDINIIFDILNIFHNIYLYNIQLNLYIFILMLEFPILYIFLLYYSNITNHLSIHIMFLLNYYIYSITYMELSPMYDYLIYSNVIINLITNEFLSINHPQIPFFKMVYVPISFSHPQNLSPD